MELSLRHLRQPCHRKGQFQEELCLYSSLQEEWHLLPGEFQLLLYLLRGEFQLCLHLLQGEFRLCLPLSLLWGSSVSAFASAGGRATFVSKSVCSASAEGWAASNSTSICFFSAKGRVASICTSVYSASAEWRVASVVISVCSASAEGSSVFAGSISRPACSASAKEFCVRLRWLCLQPRQHRGEFRLTHLSWWQ